MKLEEALVLFWHFDHLLNVSVVEDSQRQHMIINVKKEFAVLLWISVKGNDRVEAKSMGVHWLKH